MITVGRFSQRTQRSVRSAATMVTPLIAELLFHLHGLGALAALGAIWTVGQDGPGSWEQRRNRMAQVAFAGGLGTLLGASAERGWSGLLFTVAVLGAAGLVAGFIEASRFASAGMCGLLGVIAGSGVPSKWAPLVQATAITTGGLWVLTVAAALDARTSSRGGRPAISSAFSVLARRFAEPEQRSLARSSVMALNEVEDALLSTSGRRRNGSEIQALGIVAFQIGELSSVLELGDRVLDGAGRALVVGGCRDLERSTKLGDAAGALACARALSAAATSSGSPLVAAAFAVPRVTLELGRRDASRSGPPIGQRLRFALQLGVAVASAVLVATALHGPKSYWLPLAVAYIARPDLGPVVQRALARALGTVLGVLIAGLLVVTGAPAWGLAGLCIVMAALLPAAVGRSHLLAVVCFTPIVFAVIGSLEPTAPLLMPRIIDTALGAAIVLMVDGLIWMQIPARRPDALLDRARTAARRYSEVTSATSPLERHLRRREAIRAVHLGRLRVEEVRRELLKRRRTVTVPGTAFDAVDRTITAHTHELLGLDSLD